MPGLKVTKKNNEQEANTQAEGAEVVIREQDA